MADIGDRAVTIASSRTYGGRMLVRGLCSQEEGELLYRLLARYPKSKVCAAGTAPCEIWVDDVDGETLRLALTTILSDIGYTVFQSLASVAA